MVFGQLTMSLLCEQKVRLTSCREIGNTISSIEQRRALVRGQVAVWTDGERLVVTKPATFTISNGCSVVRWKWTNLSS